MMTTTWTDETPQARNIRNLKKAIRGCEKMGIIPSRTAYKRANLPVPKKATNEYQPVSYTHLTLPTIYSV